MQLRTFEVCQVLEIKNLAFGMESRALDKKG